MTEIKEMVSQDKTVLKNKTVELVLIEKRPNTIMKSGADVTLLKGGSRSFRLTKDLNGFLVDPLTKDERTELEEILGFDLSIYKKNTAMNPKANYWISHRSSRIKLTRSSDELESATIKLNLRDPIDFLRYKICLVHPKVANKWAERNNPNFIYALRDVEDLDKEMKATVDTEDAVLEYLFEHKKSHKKMFDLLRLYGAEELPKDIQFKKQNANWMYTQLRSLTKTKKHIDGLYNIISLDEKVIEQKTFLEDAISCGMITRYGSEFKLSGGGTLGYSAGEVISYINKAEYQNTKFKIQDAIDIYFDNKKPKTD